MNDNTQQKIKQIKTFSLVHIIVGAIVCLYVSVIMLSAYIGSETKGQVSIGLGGMAIIVLAYILFLVFHFVQKKKVASGHFMKKGKFLGMSIPYFIILLLGYVYYKLASGFSPIYKATSLPAVQIVPDILVFLSFFPLVILFIDYIYLAKHLNTQKVVINKDGKKVVVNVANNQKTGVKEKVKAYNVLIYIAMALAIISLAAFALPYLAEEKYNMFQWTFGISDGIKNAKLTFNFVWEIIIIALCILLFSFKKNKAKLVITAPLSSVLAIFSMVAAITCLSSNKNNLDFEGSTLSAGPIMYSVLQFVAMAIMLVGVAIELYNNEGVRHFFKRDDVSTTSSNAKSEKRVAIKKNSVIEKTVSSEGDTIKALKEYKELLDAGIITKAEFDKKKKDLLNK